jgi:all-trans-retinol 13,14-reductase
MKIHGLKGYLYMHFCHKKDPLFAQSGVILSYMTIDEMKPWLNTFTGNRGYRLSSV